MLDKGRIKQLVSWIFVQYGPEKTVEFLELCKTTGFHEATMAGISLGIEDLRIPPTKESLIKEAKRQSNWTEKQHQRGTITAVERTRSVLDIWHNTSEKLKEEVIETFVSMDPFNPVYMMAFSGARGNLSQVRQLVGMRGLMSDSEGKILDFPIISNFREGLTVTEYMISCYGARKGLVDTALRTANSGYLTRRLIDVAQDVVIRVIDCGTPKGITVNINQICGRVLALDLPKLDSSSHFLISLYYSLSTPNFLFRSDNLANRNDVITTTLAARIREEGYKDVIVRSPLTCEVEVCQMCYGWSLAKGELVHLGEAVGILAAQSIGEPGTQLTMRTFHTGGVFSGEAGNLIRAPWTGKILYQMPGLGSVIRTRYGSFGFLLKNQNRVFVQSSNGPLIGMNLPAQTILLVRHGEFVRKYQRIAESNISIQGVQATHPVLSSTEGQTYFSNLKSGKGGSARIAKKGGSLWVLSGKKVTPPVPGNQIGLKADLIHKYISTHSSITPESGVFLKGKMYFSFGIYSYLKGNILKSKRPIWWYSPKRKLKKLNFVSPGKIIIDDVTFPNTFVLAKYFSSLIGFMQISRNTINSYLNIVFQSRNFVKKGRIYPKEYKPNFFYIFKNQIGAGYSVSLLPPRQMPFIETNVQNKIYPIKWIFRHNPVNTTYASIDFGGEFTQKNSIVQLKDLQSVKINFPKIGEFLRENGQIIQKSKNLVIFRTAFNFLISPGAEIHVHNGEWVQTGRNLVTLVYEQQKTEDIVQGLPKIEELLEARHTKDLQPIPNNIHQQLNKFIHLFSQRNENIAKASLTSLQPILVKRIQNVYANQGVQISEKHIEIIVRKMTSKVKITYVDPAGRIPFLPGELVELTTLESKLWAKKAAEGRLIYEPAILGITKASLEAGSFISAASFQETTRVLTKAAIEQKTDFLQGLKENVILGRLIPAGTGMYNEMKNDYLNESQSDEIN